MCENLLNRRAQRAQSQNAGQTLRPLLPPVQCLVTAAGRAVTSVANPDFNQMKLNDTAFCRLLSLNRPGFLGPIAHAERQKGRIMSLKTGSPLAPTICNAWPANDLRAVARNGRKQNAKNPEPGDHLLAIVSDPTNKMLPPTFANQQSAINNSPHPQPPKRPRPSRVVRPGLSASPQQKLL
jgi:hypothetical protein